MKNLILIMLTSFCLTGCSIIPRMTFDSPGATPQSIDKSKRKETCKGEAVFNEVGDMISCSRGYFNYVEGYVKKERKYTLKEKILNLFRNLSGSIFWIAIALVIFVPGSLGWIISRVFNATNKAFEQTVQAIKKFRKNSSAKEELDGFLRAEQDNTTKKIIATKRV